MMITGWFGAPGALMPVTPYQGSISESDGRVTSELISLGGVRHMQIGNGPLRSWSMSVAGTSTDLAPLKFAASQPASWVWVSPAAQVSNLLTPQQSMLDPDIAVVSGGAAIQRGAMKVGESWVPQWASGTSVSTVGLTGRHPVHVRPNVPVTISAWVQRADPSVPVEMVFDFHDATGEPFYSQVRNDPNVAGLSRAVWILIPPAGSASMSLRFRAASVVAAPQVRWGSSPGEYSDGRGVNRVVVTGWSEDQEQIQPDGSLWLSVSMTLQEVG